ncbi:MAG: FAD-dependent oxidoreductase [Lachnospiraceae bacterium]|nr:FAD-dependent oxidoreductase [Lachnospiraceae bacterium]
MSQLTYQHLFEPIRIGNVYFKNRLFSSPQDYPGLTSGERFLTEEAAYFYERKAAGGFAAVCVGDVIVDADHGRSHPFQMRGLDPMAKVNMTRVSTAIKRHTAVPSVELCHAGKNAAIDLMPEGEKFVYGPVEWERPDGVLVRQLDDEGIEKLIWHYTNAAVFAMQTGYKMITLHGGHGWQIHQFISPTENTRTDKWGGSIENSMRFPLAVIDSIRKAIGPRVPIEFRMSGSENLPWGYDIDEGIEIAKMLDGKVDIIHVSTGHHEIDLASMRTHPTMFLEDGCNLQYAEKIKAVVSTPVSTVGAYTDPEMMEDIIASGKADIICMGRQTLADPDLPIKARAGKRDEIRPCLRCFNCFSNSTVDGVFYCAVNPEIGREAASMFRKAPKFKKKVLVAGGGPGGMQAALTAAEQGHQVILCEKSGRLGGALLCEEKIPFKKNLGIYLDRQARMCEKDPAIEVRLNCTVTPEVCEEIAPDVIIAAMGARPVKPPVPGIDLPKVVGAEEIYLDIDKAGQKVVIMGGGLVGLELGVYLAENGREVTVVEMAPGTLVTPPEGGTSERFGGVMDMPAGYPLVQGVALMVKLESLPNMQVKPSTKAIEINDEGLVVETKGERCVIPADTVIYAVGQRPETAAAEAISGCAAEFYQIGDCVLPANVYEATSQAWQIAVDIGQII